MKTLKRLLLSSTGGAVIAFGLTLGMVAMIKVDFQVTQHDAIEIASINPVEEIKELPPRTIELAQIQTVETPPPPPATGFQESEEPQTLPPVTTSLPPIDPPKIKLVTQTSYQQPDRDVQPLVRMEPLMPRRAEKSGHCQMRFNVNPQGAPYDVKAVYCTQRVFERNSIKATLNFKYRPKIIDGRAVNMTGVETKLTYSLFDENGRLILE